MKKILRKAELADYLFAIDTLKSPNPFYKYNDMKKLYDKFEKTKSKEDRKNIVNKLDDVIRYSGSSDIAYFVRWIFTDEPGVKVQELVEDVAKKLKVKLKEVGSIEAKLERLVKAVVENTFFKMSNSEKREFLKKYGEDLDESDLQTAQTNLAQFMKRLLVMRFESSKEAFRSTLENMIASNKMIEDWWSKLGKVPIMKKGKIPDQIS